MTLLVTQPHQDIFDRYSTPLITRARLEADCLEALRLVPKCMAFAQVVALPGEPFDWASIVTIRPDGKHADQVHMRAIEYGIMCELKRCGGSFNLNKNKDGRIYPRSTYSRRAPHLGGNTPVAPIFADSQPHEAVTGAAHVTRPAAGSNVMTFDAITSGPSKRAPRQVALAHARRYVTLHGPKGWDVEAYIANILDLFRYRDELVAEANAGQR